MAVGGTVGVGGALVGVGVASSGRTGVGVGSGGGVGLGGGGAATVAGTGASTVAAMTAVGTVVGVSGSACCAGAEELGTVGEVATEPHPITRMANNGKRNRLRRCIQAPSNYDYLRITVELAKIDRQRKF